MEKNNTSKITNGVKLADLLKRSELSYEKLAEIDENRPLLDDEVTEEVEIQVSRRKQNL